MTVKPSRNRPGLRPLRGALVCRRASRDVVPPQRRTEHHVASIKDVVHDDDDEDRLTLVFPS